jgi:hypothetical protein
MTIQLGTIKRGGALTHLWARPNSLSEMVRSSKCFPRVRKILALLCIIQWVIH